MARIQNYYWIQAGGGVFRVSFCIVLRRFKIISGHMRWAGWVGMTGMWGENRNSQKKNVLSHLQAELVYGRALGPGIVFFLILKFRVIKSRNFDLVSRNFDLVTRNFDLVSRNFDLLSRNYLEISTYYLEIST